jgi:hypothetical protein
MGWKTAIAIAIIVFALILTVIAYLVIEVPANVQYGNLFGANVNGMTQTASSLTGPDSMQYYLMQIWTQMNQTFAGFNYATTYNSYWSWDHTTDNTLAFQNEWFNSINQTIYSQQKWLDEVEAGNASYTGGNPILTAVNTTRSEFNTYGGIDWVIGPAWYLNFATTAYWLWMYVLIIWILAIIAAVILIVVDPTSQNQN